MSKYMNISSFVLVLMFMLLPIDMFNGFLLHNNINLPLSLGQLYKFIILLFLFTSLLLKPNKLILSLGLVFLLLIPSLFQVFLQFRIDFLFNDIIKIIRYLTPVFAFLFFVDYIKKEFGLGMLFKLVKFSFIVFSLNILLKYVGLGYPMYFHNNIGSKGFFYAGNETSVVLIILSAIIGYNFWLERRFFRYFLFFIFTLFVGITISSKTGMLGVVLTFLFIPMKTSHIKFTFKKLNYILLFSIVIIPALVFTFIKVIVNSPIFLRFSFFWEKLDFVTFVFSHRNVFFDNALKVFYNNYHFVEKIIGVGQTKYELLNGGSIVEIDIADIFFAYGFMGLLLFLTLMLFIIYQAKLFKRTGSYPYASFVRLMAIVLLGISTIAGHVYSSGMAAVFLGLLFSLMYIKENQIETETT